MKRTLVSAVWAVTVTLSFLVFSLTLHSQNRDMTDYLKSGIVTLYAHDPLPRSFCFRDGECCL